MLASGVSDMPDMCMHVLLAVDDAPSIHEPVAMALTTLRHLNPRWSSRLSVQET